MAAVGTKRTPAKQSGAALLILLALIIPIILYAVVAGVSRSSGEIARARDLKTYAALAQAKEALIAYAVTYKDTHDDPANNKYYVPGYLPCPDFGTSTYEGQAAPLNCPPSGPSSLVSVMGRLPWRTLGLDALKDGSGECLWYAVSGTYKNYPNGVSTNDSTSNMMNWDTNGQFKVLDADGSSFLAGSSEDNRAVAVIFAPGKTLSGQDRTPASGTATCGGNYTASAYLETTNSINNSALDSPSSPALVTDFSSFIAGTGSDTFNDKLVYITRADIWNAIKKRSDFNNYLRALTRRAAECTALYGAYNGNGNDDDRLPWAGNVSISTTDIPRYAVNRRYDDRDNVTSGRLSYRVNTSRSEGADNLINSWDSSDYLFSAASYCSYTPDQQVWYDNWKDHLFYAVAAYFKPSWWWFWTYCGTCLKINSSGSYAAVVIFAGEKLTNAAGQVTQPRSSATDKGTIAYYLEGSNPASITAGTGSGNYQAAATSSTFNDIVYAIDANLAVKCYNTGTGTMVTPTTSTVAAPPGSPTAVKDYAACP